MKKTLPDTTSDANRLPRASCPPLRVHFGGFWVPFWRPRLPRASPEGPGSPPEGGQIRTSPETLRPQGGPGAPREPREASGRQFGSNFGASGRDVRHFFPSPNASRKLLRDRFLFIPLRRQQSATKDNATQHETLGTGEVFLCRVGEG